jgi:hypothetical protein
MGQYHKDYYQKNKEKISAKRAKGANRVKYAKGEYEKIKVERRILTVLKSRVATRNRAALNKLLELTCYSFVGIEPKELKIWIENQFVDGMSWDNYGKAWHIDHKIPISLAKTLEEFKILAHYKNLQPLWALENVKKGSKIELYFN